MSEAPFDEIFSQGNLEYNDDASDISHLFTLQVEATIDTMMILTLVTAVHRTS